MSDGVLFGWDTKADQPEPTDTPGPVYQGTSKAIRYLEQLQADPDADRAFPVKAHPLGKPGAAWSARWAGTIAQARSLAASIDRASGRDPKRRQAAGRDLANLHEQLDALMLRLDPQQVAVDGPSEFDQLSEELASLELEQRRRAMDA